ncbi:hypothetical protein [Eikenella corrodens]|uniref:hypothetical protein n=1 Tax=Eikenella corrodens TaxID=539 RepID=UPI000667081B|nr:hypothetical protein [Eikenella corrodens]
MSKRIPAPLNVFLSSNYGYPHFLSIVYTISGIAQQPTGGTGWAMALSLSLLLIVASAAPVWLLGYRFKRSSVLATIFLLGIIAGIGGLTGNAFNIAWGIGWALYLMLSKDVKQVYSD